MSDPGFPSPLRLALHHPATADPEAPVVLRFAAMGDVVLLTVLLAALAERHARPVHLLSSGDWTPQLLAADPAVGELRLVTSRKSPYWLTPSQWSAVRWLKAHRGPVVLCDPDPAARALLDRAGIPAARILAAWDHLPSGPFHWADWWLQVAALDPPGLPGPARSPTARAQPRLHLPPEWRSRAEAIAQREGWSGRPIVLVQPGNKKTHRRGRLATAYYDKHWPAERWGEVIRGIAAALPQVQALVCGSPREAGLAQTVVQAAEAAGPLPQGGRVANLARLGEGVPLLCALAERAHSMVSIDTGPAHAAAALDCPLVVIYGSAGWAQWRPRAPTSQVSVLGDRLTVPGARAERFSAEQVLRAWQALPPRGQRLAADPATLG